ncbi:hypothetical protein SADUNF_Sadunf12G0079200 [Salix dunnii]|uniref:HMA domain-containing protein n=1 Tax=Salix dunnii TaxID=1413687 RepID=A0A835MN73_9ROSI|nr:hypothetical protein SADUNF_Sadunf12G0079200 [Salix dunnii]
MGEEAKKPAAEPQQPKKVDEEKKEEKPAEKPATGEKKPEETKNETPTPPQEIVLQVYMHCEGCARKVHRWLKGFEGVESAEPDLKSSQVTVKGVFEPQKLVEYVHKRTGKHAVIVKQEPEKKEEEKGKEPKEEKKGEEGDKQNKGVGGGEQGENKDKKDSGGGEAKKEAVAAEEETTVETTVVELRKMDFYNYYQPERYEHYSPPPQIFSDENPNACTVM